MRKQNMIYQAFTKDNIRYAGRKTKEPKGMNDEDDEDYYGRKGRRKNGTWHLPLRETFGDRSFCRTLQCYGCQDGQWFCVNGHCAMTRCFSSVGEEHAVELTMRRKMKIVSVLGLKDSD